MQRNEERLGIIRNYLNIPAATFHIRTPYP